jgi:hypothetical protein
MIISDLRGPGVMAALRAYCMPGIDADARQRPPTELSTSAKGQRLTSGRTSFTSLVTQSGSALVV